MRRFLALLLAASLCAFPLFAQSDSEDGEDDGQTFTYSTVRAGDHYLQISLVPSFPLNFKGQMYIGGAAQIGYRYFFTSWLAVGGDIMVGYHPTLGSNIFNFWPVTAAVTFQPSVWRFEFPISLGVGVAFETYQSRKYFPGLVVRPELGVFFRPFESWSFGAGASFMWLPQWYAGENSRYNFDGLFMTASLSVRYHF